jgi:dienelactone hydrolase
MVTGLIAASAALLLQAAAGAPSSALRPSPSATSDAAMVRPIAYTQADGTRNAATLVTPASARRAPRPAVLYLHWYEPPRPTSNRTEFLAEAVDLAGSGVVSLLIDTPWSGEKWFATRDAAHDYEFTLAMAGNVRSALDVLLAQPDIDKTRIALVGHDFGAMWGALAAGDDRRVTHLVFMAGSPSFSDWYLFTPKREGADKDAFVEKLAPLASAKALARFSPRPVLLQFGTKDKFVSNEDAKAMADAVAGPQTTFKTYEFEHELTWQARVDRLAWLREQFRLR